MNEIEAVGASIGVDVGPSVAEPPVERPWIFGLLVAPSAAVANGVIQGGALAYLFRHQGLGIGRISHLIWLLALPTSIYFLWSPVTDFLVRRRTWLLMGSVGAGLLMAAAFFRKDLASTTSVILIFLSGCCGQLVVSSCGGMMGALHSERSKRVAGGFYQAGSLAFGALAAFLLLLVSARYSRPLLGLLAGVIIALPGAFVLAAPRQGVLVEGDFGKTMGRIWTEFKSTFLRWSAVPYTLTMLFPIASGSAIGLLPGVAQDYGVNGEHVAWVNGLGGGLLMGAGSLAATLIPARGRASVIYLTVALINAGTLGVLWLGPLRPSTYYIGLILYLFTIGTAYAMFTAVVLEFLGSSGKSGSGRYSIINSLGNVPVLYMILLDGWGGAKFGPRGVSGAEAVAGAVGCTLLLVYFLTQTSAESLGAHTVNSA